MQDPTTPTRDSSGRLWQICLLVAASAFGPLTVLADANEKPRLLTFFIVVAGVSLVSVGLWLLLIRFGLDSQGASYAVATFVLIVMNAVAWFGADEVSRLLLLAGAVILAALAYRLRHLALTRWLATWATLFLVAYPLATLGLKALAQESLNVTTSTDLEVGAMAAKPDILMVVMDAYGGTQTLSELYGFDNHELRGELISRGFEVPDGVLANYGRTQLSIPTVLQLDYVAETTVLTDDDVQALLGVLDGRSRLSRALADQGYRTVHVESGWLGSRCGPDIDICVNSPWPDETFYDAAYRSLLVDLPGFEVGRPFTMGALSAADWLVNEMPPLLDDDRPDFIFAHLLLPHPPLFLNNTCQPDWDGGQNGFARGLTGFDEEDTDEARELYLRQVQCANSIILNIARGLGDDDVVLIMGDHGPDSQGQLFVQSETWSDAQRRERFNAFLATRVPGCEMAGIQSLVNVGRRMMGCLTGSSLPDLPIHIFDIHKTLEENRVIELDLPGSETLEANS